MNKIFPFANNGQALKITDQCKACGICTKVCPIGNIILANQHAQRLNEKCEFCLACIHHCPHHAIRLKRERNPQERYRNEKITLDEIISANHQTKKKN